MELVVPRLQRHGVFRTEYAGRPCVKTLAWRGPDACPLPSGQAHGGIGRSLFPQLTDTACS
ncbi:hypothetical protein RAA17_15105 [Komagataeibacter rhaeticus]|nr:hypothetical protein [Komagataeibacter rhaeticus]